MSFDVDHKRTTVDCRETPPSYLVDINGPTNVTVAPPIRGVVVAARRGLTPDGGAKLP